MVHFSLLMAMSFIANYVVCMRASSGIRYVVHRTFRLGVVSFFLSFFLFFLVNLTQERNEENLTKERTRKELYIRRIQEHVCGASKCERRGTLVRLIDSWHCSFFTAIDYSYFFFTFCRKSHLIDRRNRPKKFEERFFFLAKRKCARIRGKSKPFANEKACSYVQVLHAEERKKKRNFYQRHAKLYDPRSSTKRRFPRSALKKFSLSHSLSPSRSFPHTLSPFLLLAHVTVF